MGWLSNELKNRIKQKYKQYEDADGSSQSVPENKDSLAKKVVGALTDDNLAEKIKARHEKSEAKSERAKKVARTLTDDNLAEKIKARHEKSEAKSERAKKVARTLTDDNLAEKIKAHHEKSESEEDQNLAVSLRKAASKIVESRRDTLREELNAQSADEQHLTGQLALAQVKFDLSLHNASKRDNYVEELTPEEKAEENKVAPTIQFVPYDTIER